MKVKSESEVAQSCLTLLEPMDSSLPVSSIHGIFQARVLEWAAIAFSNPGLSDHKIPWCLALGTSNFTIESLEITGNSFGVNIRGDDTSNLKDL